MEHLQLSRYHVATPPFLDGVDNQVKRIVFATRTAEMILLNEVTWDAVMTGSLGRLPADLVGRLRSAELLVPADEIELETVLARNKRAIRDDTTLPLVIQPTAHCQLGCGYCGQEHFARWLNRKHQDELIARYTAKLETGTFSSFDVCWFGAEPLAGINVIRALSPRLQALATQFDCAYNASIVTNGLALTDSVATEIVTEHNIRSFTITLDGTAEHHDARRHRKNGRETFDEIFANVVSLARRRDLEIEIKIRSNVDRRNAVSISGLLQMLVREGIQDRIKYYIAPIHSWGNDAHMLSLSADEFAAQEIKWFCEMIRLGFGVGFIPAVKPVVCLVVQPHGELVDATGTLFNCTEVSYVPAYGTPNTFAIGHLSSGEVPRKRELLGDFNDRVGRGEYPCSTCRMLPVCGGACPKSWLEGLPPCPSTKYNIEERLLLSYAVSRLIDGVDVAPDTTVPTTALMEVFDR